MTGEQWRRDLQEARERLGLSRAEVARRASVSPETVRGYEAGRRRPTMQSLIAILDALKLDRTQANRIRLALGFAPDQRDYRTPSAADQYTVEELRTELERLAWPAFAADEFMYIVAANTAAQRLWGVDLEREFLDLSERHFLRLASDPRFAERCLNWDEAVGVMIGMWKGHHRGPENLDEPSLRFEGLLEGFLSGDPKYVRRFLDLWERTPPREPKVRVQYPIVWRDDAGGTMRFLGVQGRTSGRRSAGTTGSRWTPRHGRRWRSSQASR